MDQVSRPMQIALAATLLLAVVWFVALRPKPSAGGESAAPAPAAQQTTGAAPGTEGLKHAVDEAHQAAATANGDAQRAAASSADGAGESAGAAPAGAQTAAGSADPTVRTRPHEQGGAPRAARHAAASGQVATVRVALRERKAVAVAFVDPSTADARAVADELRHVSRFGGRAVALAVPIARLSDYGFITNKVEVTVAPTVVIVDPRHRATTIVGYTDRGEIEQRLADALAARRPKG